MSVTRVSSLVHTAEAEICQRMSENSHVMKVPNEASGDCRNPQDTSSVDHERPFARYPLRCFAPDQSGGPTH